jgi:photosystem II stability/assembly factor-like uncharacterized protein
LARGDALHAWVYTDQPGTSPDDDTVSGRLLATSDAGITWHEVPTLPEDLLNGCTLSYGSKQLWLACASPGKGGYYGSAQYKSLDGGQHWTMTSGTGSDNTESLYNLTIVAPDHVFAGDFPAAPLLFTSDGGRTWDTVLDPDYFGGCCSGLGRLIFVDELHGWGVFQQDVFQENFGGKWLLRTTDGGKTWQDVVVQ